MSFGELVFSAGLFQKIGMEDQNVKKNLTMTKTTLEGSRGHQKTPHHDRPQEAARWGRRPHHGAARSPTVAPAC
jgi:hypothetical protein